MINQSPVAGGQPSLKHGWYAVGLVILANVSSFPGRQILALPVAPMKKNMHLTDSGFSLLTGLSLTLFYNIFGILIGRLVDEANRRNLGITGIAV